MDSDAEGEESMASRTWSSVRSREPVQAEDIESPFPGLEVDLSTDELRETAYEVLVCATVLSGEGSKSPGSPHSPAHAAVRRLKKALTIKSRRKSGGEFHHSSRKSMGDLDIARFHMEISERRDGRIRKALSKAADRQAGSRAESLLVPVELLLYLSSSDFSNNQEYQRWQRRQLKVLEAGLLVHPGVIHEDSNAFGSLLRKAIDDIRDRPAKGGKRKEVYQALRVACCGLAGDECHWADGFPLNIHLYDMLLRSLFDSLEEGSFIFEIDQMMELVKKTWGILGINQILHHICFTWVLFRQFIVSGQTEAELLRAAEVEMKEAQRCSKFEGPSLQSDLLYTILTYVHSWAEERLLSYHEHFDKKETRAMEALVSICILSAQILNEPVSEEEDDNSPAVMVDEYIQTSVTACFHLLEEELCEEGKPNALSLVNLAKAVGELAVEETESFSPSFKQWHPSPPQVVSSTLHACFRKQLKQFLTKATEPSKEVVQALESAAALERKLVQISGGFDFFSYASDPTIITILTKWLQQSMKQLREWAERNVQQEKWNPDALREHYAISGVEVLRMIEDTLDAFFKLPVNEHPSFLWELVNGVDTALESYASLAIDECEGVEENMFPDERTTSLKASSSLIEKVGEVWKKRSETVILYRNKVWPQLSEYGGNNREDRGGRLNVEQLCVRINTLYYIETQMEFLEKKIRYGWQEAALFSSPHRQHHNQQQQQQVKFVRARKCCEDGMTKLFEYSASKIVFGDKKLWERLCAEKLDDKEEEEEHYHEEERRRSRTRKVVDYLNSQLKVVAATISDWLRDRMVKQLMRVSFEGYVQAVAEWRRRWRRGGAVTVAEVEMLEEEFNQLKDLFKAEGEGLKEELVDKISEPVLDYLKGLLVPPSSPPPSPSNVEDGGGGGGGGGVVVDLEANLRLMFMKAKSPPVPHGLQHLTNTNVFATMVGYRCHSLASKFVKKSYDFTRQS